MRLMDHLTRNPFTLIVSLPRNDVELARAALDAGADALKVHIHVQHRASGTHFGSLADELNAIEAICSLSDRPVGLVPGDNPFAHPEELRQACRLGIDFLDAYTHHLPVYALDTPLTIMAALDYSFSPSAAEVLHQLEFVHCIEASIVHPEGYGQALNLADVIRYREIAVAGKKPVVVPTQRALAPEELHYLAAVGVRGIVLGAVVTGTTAQSLAQAVTAFKNAANRLHGLSHGNRSKEVM